jgi:hypothetical protein
MGLARTSTYPSRSYPQVQGGVVGPELPVSVPGGFGQPTGLPSQLLQPYYRRPRNLVRGGHWGAIRLFQPNIDKQAPYIIGHNEGFSVPSIDGRPITWLHRWFINSAGVREFLPYNMALPDWTSNNERGESHPISPIPMGLMPTGIKRLNAQGGYQRTFNVDNQLFSRGMVVPHPPAPTRQFPGAWAWRNGPAGWPIQRPGPKNVRTQMKQGMQQAPWYVRLTRLQPAASYGQTTQTLLPSNLANLLPNVFGGQRNPDTVGGGTYGSYY